MMKSISGSNLSANQILLEEETNDNSKLHLYICIGCYVVAIIFLVVYLCVL